MDGKLSRYIEIDVGLPKYEKISQKKEKQMNTWMEKAYK